MIQIYIVRILKLNNIKNQFQSVKDITSFDLKDSEIKDTDYLLFRLVQSRRPYVGTEDTVINMLFIKVLKDHSHFDAFSNSGYCIDKGIFRDS